MIWATLAFLVTIAVLIVVHEFGHFVVARLCGVKVLRFSVGFGRTLLMRRFGADGTEWAICAFPLGGYVKMLDEGEGPVEPQDLPRAFNRLPVWRRMLVVVAGPLANLLLAVFLYWLLFMHGSEELRPVLAAPPAATAAAAAASTASRWSPGRNCVGNSPKWSSIMHLLSLKSSTHNRNSVFAISIRVTSRMPIWKAIYPVVLD